MSGGFDRELEQALDEEPNDPGNEDPGSLMDDAQVPLHDPDRTADEDQG